MTGAQKRLALLALAGQADRSGLGLIDAALTQIASLDLSDPKVCAKWARHCEQDGSARPLDRRAGILLKAGGILRAVPS